MSDPMTPERIAKLRAEQIDRIANFGSYEMYRYEQDLFDALDEIERLRGALERIVAVRVDESSTMDSARGKARFEITESALGKARFEMREVAREALKTCR